MEKDKRLLVLATRLLAAHLESFLFPWGVRPNGETLSETPFSLPRVVKISYLLLFGDNFLRPVDAVAGSRVLLLTTRVAEALASPAGVVCLQMYCPFTC